MYLWEWGWSALGIWLGSEFSCWQLMPSISKPSRAVANWCAMFTLIYWTISILEVCEQGNLPISFGVQMKGELCL